MENKTNSRVGNTANWPEEQANNSHNVLPTERLVDYNDLPYEDPAVVNPQELASFPEPAEIVDAQDVENENTIHMVTPNKNPVREGRNIISTDNNPDRDGFM
ncbi:MAG: hypothetical protein V4581_17305 [Bacteroidota bacterium]